MKKYLAILPRFHHTSFLTLTVRAAPDLIQPINMFDAVGRAFARLRRRKVWGRKRGIWAMDLQVNESTRTPFHVHLHAILLGGTLPQIPLHRAWAEEAARQGLQAERLPDLRGITPGTEPRVLGYMLRAWEVPDHLRDHVRAATRNRRLVNAFGLSSDSDALATHAVVCQGCHSAGGRWRFVETLSEESARAWRRKLRQREGM